MPVQMIRQTMFTSGQVDEITWKRTDIKEYLTAAQLLENFEVGTTGLCKKRKGTQYLVDPTEKSIPTSSLYEFTDRDNVHYLVLASNLKFTIYKVENNTLTLYGSDVVTPYTSDEIQALDYTQDNDSVVFAHPNHPLARLYISTYSPSATFAYQALTIYPQPAYDFSDINYNNFDVQLTVGGTHNSVLTFKFVGVGANPGFNNDWIDGQIIGGGASPEQPLGYAIITAVSFSAGGGGTVTFTATIFLPFEETNYAIKGAQYSVKKPIWSATLGYPSKVLFFQNRLWAANTKSLPTTIVGSKINAPINFDVGAGADTNAIIYTLGQTNSGPILWLNGGKQLEIYCQNYEFACPQDDNSGLTPSTFSIRQQSSYGSSITFKPVTYINDSYYINREGKSLINFHFNGVGLTYQSSNISAASASLIKAPTNGALLRGSDQSQDNFIYLLNPSDNTLTAFQFASEYKLAALTPIKFERQEVDEVLTDVVNLIDIVSVDNEIYLLKYFTLTEKYSLEKFTDDIKMDSYLEKNINSSGDIADLEFFEGYVMRVYFNGQDFGSGTVGEFMPGVLHIDGWIEGEQTVTVGLIYSIQLNPMFLYAGSVEAPFMKNISRIYVDYYQSLDFYINDKLVAYQSFSDIQHGLPLTPRTDTAIISPVLGWDRFQTFSITQSSPFDLQILSIGYQIDAAVI